METGDELFGWQSQEPAAAVEESRDLDAATVDRLANIESLLAAAEDDVDHHNWRVADALAEVRILLARKGDLRARWFRELDEAIEEMCAPSCRDCGWPARRLLTGVWTCTNPACAHYVRVG